MTTPDTITRRQTHPAADLFPMMTDDEYTELVESIRVHGQREPVWVDEQGQILDGRNRVRACDQLGIPYNWRIYTGHDPIQFVIDLNLHRRHLTTGQRAAVAYDMLPMLEESARERMLAGKADPGADLPQGTDEERAPRARDRAAELAGTSGRAVGQFKRLAEHTPDLADEVRDGTLTLHAAETELKSRLYPGEAEAVTETPPEAGIPATPDTVLDSEAEAIESRQPKPAITKPDLDGTGISHPARYSDTILERFTELLADTTGRVLDPFAGTGRIHELARDDLHTTGIEIEPEWARLHPDTIIGNALNLPFPDETFDAIVTSPTYGNRLSDHHNATDPHLRRSYTHDLGRDLDLNNSGAMAWGLLYRAFHADAWKEAVRVLAPGGLFILNIKDHIRGGTQQIVSHWHVACLSRLGLRLDPERSGGVPTRHLRQGSTTERAGQELVLVFTRHPGFQLPPETRGGA